MQKSWEGGDKNILRAGKGDLSEKCGHLPSSNHPPGKQPLAKSNYLLQQKIPFYVLILLAEAGFPLFTLAGGPGGIFQKPFLGRRRQRRGSQSAILLPASHDTIGHYWTSGPAGFNSLPNQRHFCHFQIL